VTSFTPQPFYPRYLLCRRLHRPQGLFERCGEENNLLPLPVIETLVLRALPRTLVQRFSDFARPRPGNFFVYKMSTRFNWWKGPAVEKHCPSDYTDWATTRPDTVHYQNKNRASACGTWQRFLMRSLPCCVRYLYLLHIAAKNTNQFSYLVKYYSDFKIFRTKSISFIEVYINGLGDFFNCKKRNVNTQEA
jgi:hypothetical protein